MPPKPKYSKDEIINAAYEIMEEQGIDAVVAREVGKKLGTTTGPIFTFFSGMDELKEAVYQKCIKEVLDYLKESLEYVPAFKEFGLRTIRYAYKHQNAYQLIFLKYNIEGQTSIFNRDILKILEPMTGEISRFFDITYDQATDLIEKMAIYTHGVASLVIASGVDFPEEKINHDFSIMCLSLVAGCKIKNGDFDLNRMKAILDNPDIIPVKKPKNI